MLTCEKASELVGDYIDGLLPFSMKMELGMHIMICRHCRRYFKQIKHVISLVDLSHEPEPQEPVRNEEALVNAFKQRHSQND